MNDEKAQNVSTLEEWIEDFQFVSVTSSFSKFTEEEFKQLAYKIHEDFYQRMVSLFEGLNEIQEMYNKFELHSDLLHDHNQRRNEETSILLIPWYNGQSLSRTDLIICQFWTKVNSRGFRF